MAKVTNITGEDLDVPVLDNRTVAAGETVEVDDDLIAHDVDGETVGYAWPESTWKVETTPKKTAKQAQAKAAVEDAKE